MNIGKKIWSRVSWEAYQFQVARRWAAWERRGGGLRADSTFAQFALINRPTFDVLRDVANGPAPGRLEPRLMEEAASHPTDSLHYIDERVIISPQAGFVFVKGDILLLDSVAWARRNRPRNMWRYFSAVPSYATIRGALRGEVASQYIRTCVSLRHVFESNYGHCLIQLLASLQLLDEAGVGADVPILVSGELVRLPFFKELITRGRMRQRTWMPADTFVCADEVFIPRIEWPSTELLNRLLDDLEIPQPSTLAGRRIFVDRATRSLHRIHEHHAIIRKLGYQIVRPELLNFDEQIRLFGSAETIAGVLGAGLTNLVFRRSARTTLLELTACDECDPFFFKLARTAGYSYRSLVGSPYEFGRRHDNFGLDANVLHKFLD